MLAWFHLSRYRLISLVQSLFTYLQYDPAFTTHRCSIYLISEWTVLHVISPDASLVSAGWIMITHRPCLMASVHVWCAVSHAWAISQDGSAAQLWQGAIILDSTHFQIDSRTQSVAAISTSLWAILLSFESSFGDIIYLKSCEHLNIWTQPTANYAEDILLFSTRELTSHEFDEKRVATRCTQTLLFVDLTYCQDWTVNT